MAPKKQVPSRTIEEKMSAATPGIKPSSFHMCLTSSKRKDAGRRITCELTLASAPKLKQISLSAAVTAVMAEGIESEINLSQQQTESSQETQQQLVFWN